MTANAHVSFDSMRLTGSIQLGAGAATRLRAVGSTDAYEPAIDRWIGRDGRNAKQYQSFAGKGADIVKRGRRP